jgi:opacity protein-like surface antigen
VNFSKKKIVVVTSIAILFPNIVLADQPVTTPAQTQRSSPRPTSPDTTPQPQSALQGLRVGSFVVKPEISVSQMYDDNIYDSRSRETEDWITIISPTLAVQSDWVKHSLKIWAGEDADIYRSNSEQNVEDYWLEAEGRYDISDKTNVYAGAGASRNHEDRGTLEDPVRSRLAAEPTRYTETKGHLGAFHQFDDISVRLGTTYEHLEYSDVPSLLGPKIDMNDRDRKLYAVGGRVSLKLSPKYEAFVQASTDRRRYDLSGVGRDSDGYRVAAGMGFDFGGNNKVEAYIGHLMQDYDNSALADVSKPYFGAEANFAVGPSTYLKAFLDRELGETTVLRASSYLDTTLGAKVEHDVSQDFSLNGRLAFTRSEYQGLDQNENYLDAGFGAKYYVSRDWYVAGDYRVQLRESSVETSVVNGSQYPYDFAKNQIYVSVGYTPGRVPRPVNVADASSPGIYLAATDISGLEIPTGMLLDYSGFYAGAQAGYGEISTEVFSNTDEGTEETDLGKIGGSTYGLFAGYGQMRNRWYYGIEAEVENSSANWYQSKDKLSARTMSMDKNESYGLALRLGYALDGGLLYGRFGWVRTNFDVYDTANQFAATGAYKNDKDLDGYRYGVGLDIPASNSLFVRMNYTYTDYDQFKTTSYANVTGTELTVDRMDNKESLFNVGLGWRFDGKQQPIPQVDAASARGFYVGAKVGYGSLNTKLDAIQNDGGKNPCVNCAYTGDLGKTGGTWGFFGGYGTTYKRYYLGLEVEAEASEASWANAQNMDSGGGRDVSVNKAGSYGASIKIGYVLNNGALLYARAGEVRTRFNTTYNKGPNSQFWVDRDDIQNGNRLGVGAEVPAYRKLFVKMDYTVTDYDDYGFTTGQGRPDTVNFENKESLFSLGLGMRF